MGQRFNACFVLKLPTQRGEGEKWEGVQISEQDTHRTFDPINNSTPVHTVYASIGGPVRFRDAGRPDVVGEGDVLLELEDREVHVSVRRVVAGVLVDGLDLQPPRAVTLLRNHAWLTQGSLKYRQWFNLFDDIQCSTCT